MTSVSIKQARANLDRLIDLAAELHEPIHISGGRRAGVLVSAEYWDAVQETLHLLSVPGMRASIHKAATEPIAESAKDFRW
jgi:antitoxin YefM